MKVSNYCFALLVVVLVTSASFASPITLIDNNAWTYYLNAGEVQNNATPGSHSLVSDFGGSLKVAVSGAPGSLAAYQPILAPIHTGDVVTLTLAHSDLGNFAGMLFAMGTEAAGSESNLFYDGSLGRDTEPVNQLYSVTWTADTDYSTGTNIYWNSCAWPGTATFWIQDATVTPEPATLSLLGLGLAGLIARRKRK